MGNFHSRLSKTIKILDKNCKKSFSIKILELDARIDNHPTIIDERSISVLKYKTPRFR
jgi:hypothetical protein